MSENVTLKRWDGKSLTGSASEFKEVLDVAERYGWRERGARRPPGHDAMKSWDGAYWPPVGQTVAPIEAVLIAKALKHAFVDGAAENESEAMTLQGAIEFFDGGEFQIEPGD